MECISISTHKALNSIPVLTPLLKQYWPRTLYRLYYNCSNKAYWSSKSLHLIIWHYLEFFTEIEHYLGIMKVYFNPTWWVFYQKESWTQAHRQKALHVGEGRHQGGSKANAACKQTRERWMRQKADFSIVLKKTKLVCTLSLVFQSEEWGDKFLLFKSTHM